MNGEKIAHQRKSASTVGGLRLFFAALVAACLVGAGAQAASQERHLPKPEKHKSATTLAVKDPDTTSSIQDSGEGNCARARQRFFVKGEGWIVRRVTTCH